MCTVNAYRRVCVKSDKNALHFYTKSHTNMDIRARKSCYFVCLSMNVEHNLLSTGRRAYRQYPQAFAYAEHAERTMPTVLLLLVGRGNDSI